MPTFLLVLIPYSSYTAREKREKEEEREGWSERDGDDRRRRMQCDMKGDATLDFREIACIVEPQPAPNSSFPKETIAVDAIGIYNHGRIRYIRCLTTRSHETMFFCDDWKNRKRRKEEGENEREKEREGKASRPFASFLHGRTNGWRVPANSFNDTQSSRKNSPSVARLWKFSLINISPTRSLLQPRCARSPPQEE